MSAATLVAVGLAGGCGALARFAVDSAVSRAVGRRLPLGTCAVNLSGALLLGMVTGAALADDAARIVGTGAIGAYTTFSTWALESHRLGEDGQLRWGLANFAVPVLLGLLAAELGRRIGALL